MCCNRNKSTWIILLFVSGFLGVMLKGCDCSSDMVGLLLERVDWRCHFGSVIRPTTLNGTVTETNDDDIGMTIPCVPDDFNATEIEEKNQRIYQSSKYFVLPWEMFSIETFGGVSTRIDPIKRMIDLSFRESRVFTTCHDGQTSMTIKVLVNFLELGRFELSGIPPAPRGVPQIEVRMELENSARTLRVTAEDKATKKSQTFTSKLLGYYSCELVERMAMEGQKYQEREWKEAERIHVRKKLRSFIDMWEKGPDELALAGEIDWDAVRLIETALSLSDAAAWLDANPTASKDDYPQKLKELGLVLHFM